MLKIESKLMMRRKHVENEENTSGNLCHSYYIKTALIDKYDV
jgi:hypothetical protein